ncbi:hypothetical protein ACFV0L_39265 [Streptosporangium canum]|uniref:GntT/GntP/DsdX family permease n=1 Tax=Streptosporangium canum TaxID=324952 RepID=UPI0036A7DEC2
MHPFLSLTLGSLAVGAIAGLPMADTITSFTTGFGSTAAGVGTLATVLLPVALMIDKALADIFAAEGTAVRTVLDFLGAPLVALLLAVIVAMFTLGGGAATDRKAIAKSWSSRCHRSRTSC